MHRLARLGLLLRSVGSIDGRKRLQKIVHILQERGITFDQVFEFSFYGPYSAGLRLDMDVLRDEKLIREESGHRYAYQPQPEFLELLNKLAGPEYPRWADFAKQLNAYEPKKLEALSTILFLQGRGYEEEGVRRIFMTRKPHLVDLLDEALQTITAMPTFP